MHKLSILTTALPNYLTTLVYLQRQSSIHLLVLHNIHLYLCKLPLDCYPKWSYCYSSITKCKYSCHNLYQRQHVVQFYTMVLIYVGPVQKTGPLVPLGMRLSAHCVDMWLCRPHSITKCLPHVYLFEDTCEIW